MMKNNKWKAMVLCAALVCAMMTGCMNAGARVMPEAEPSGQPEASVMPGLDMGQSAAPGTNAAGDVNGAGLNAPFDWLGMGATVQEKINMISEIQTSRIIVNGNTALVGVTFANQYQGEMTQRIHDMIAGEIQKFDSGIRSVAVTAEEEDVRKINEIADKIAAGTPVGELEGEIDSIVRNVTTIQ